MTTPDRTLRLPGLDGSNPLAFLAALGTLRLLESEDLGVRMGWHQAYGAWTPLLTPPAPLGEPELIDRLVDRLHTAADDPALSRWDDLSVEPAQFREFVLEAAESASAGDREWSDFAAAFGSEASSGSAGRSATIQDTAFRTMSGAGHQHFLRTMRHVLAEVTPDQVQKALFAPWAYDDPLEKSTLRWDPLDDVRYALRWRNPSGDPERKKRGAMLGANALAVQALPLFPTAVVGGHLATTGFSRIDRQTAWTWPIWEPKIPLSVVRTLLALAELQAREPPRKQLLPRGVVEVYRSRRITVGKYRNFTPAEATV